MHYPCSEGINCNTIPKGKEYLTGQRKKLSNIDIFRVKKLYYTIDFTASSLLAQNYQK